MKDHFHLTVLRHQINFVPYINKTHLFLFLSIAMLTILTACSMGSTSQEKDVWKDTFDSNVGWQLSADASATISIENGALTVEVHTPGQVAWSSHESVWQNFRATVNTEQLFGPLDNEYGILIRMENDTSFYVLSISGDGYARAALYQDGVWSVLGADWIPSPYINQGLSTNTLTVTAQDAELMLSVNNETVLQVEDATLAKGSIGLYAGAFGEGGVVIAFDELDVTELP